MLLSKLSPLYMLLDIKAQLESQSVHHRREAALELLHSDSFKVSLMTVDSTHLILTFGSHL